MICVPRGLNYYLEFRSYVEKSLSLQLWKYVQKKRWDSIF